jgi:hypothetical protein
VFETALGDPVPGPTNWRKFSHSVSGLSARQVEQAKQAGDAISKQDLETPTGRPSKGGLANLPQMREMHQHPTPGSTSIVPLYVLTDQTY